MRRALGDGGVDSSTVDYINAHGTGTKLGDVAEANLDDPDPACAVEHIQKDPLVGHVEHALSNSFGFGGQNISLLFGPASTRLSR